MSSSVTDSLRLSTFSSFMEMDSKPTEKQGIVTILGSDVVCERNKAANSLRRTLSADMSSKKWLAQNGFSPMKKIASSEELSVAVPSDSSSTSEGDEEEEYCGKFNIWSEKKNKEEEEEKPGQFDIWSSIVSQKANEDPSKSLLPPYIHPLVKRSASALSENSLKICTESLGSETGSDGFSSYPASEASDIEVADKEEEEEEAEHQVKEQPQTFFNGEDHYGAVKFNHGGGGSRKSLPAARSFPPPIPSLSPSVNGASLRMQTRRDNGRLVLEAVSIPSLKSFRAERQDGRLVLTFLDTTSPASFAEDIPMVDDQEKQSNEEEFDEKVVNFDHEEEGEEERERINIGDDEEEEEEDEVDDEEVATENKFKDREIVMEETPKLSRVLNVHRLAIMMNKPKGLPNRNVPAWPSKFNGVISTRLEGDDHEEQLTVRKPVAAQSLPPRSPVARMIPSSQAKVTGTVTSAAASLNAYEYYWRPKPTAIPGDRNPHQNNNTNTLILSKNQMANEQQKLAVLRGNNGDNMVPLLKGCKKPTRSLLISEPYCIATS